MISISQRKTHAIQIEDRFTPYGKETLAKLVYFLQVCRNLVLRIPQVHDTMLCQDEILPSVKLAHAQIPKDPVQRWKTVVPVIEELKVKARKLGLWNLFLSKTHYPEHGVPLTNVEVRYFCSICCKYTIDDRVSMR